MVALGRAASNPPRVVAWHVKSIGGPRGSRLGVAIGLESKRAENVLAAREERRALSPSNHSMQVNSSGQPLIAITQATISNRHEPGHSREQDETKSRADLDDMKARSINY